MRWAFVPSASITDTDAITTGSFPISFNARLLSIMRKRWKRVRIDQIKFWIDTEARLCFQQTYALSTMKKSPAPRPLMSGGHWTRDIRCPSCPLGSVRYRTDVSASSCSPKLHLNGKTKEPLKNEIRSRSLSAKLTRGPFQDHFLAWLRVLPLASR